MGVSVFNSLDCINMGVGFNYAASQFAPRTRGVRHEMKVAYEIPNLGKDSK